MQKQDIATVKNMKPPKRRRLAPSFYGAIKNLARRPAVRALEKTSTDLSSLSPLPTI